MKQWLVDEKQLFLSFLRRIRYDSASKLDALQTLRVAVHPQKANVLREEIDARLAAIGHMLKPLKAYERAWAGASSHNRARVWELNSHQIEGMTQTGLAAIEASAVRLLSREEAEREDRLYWHSKTGAERLAAAEQLREVAYGYDAAAARIQAVVVRTLHK